MLNNTIDPDDLVTTLKEYEDKVKSQLSKFKIDRNEREAKMVDEIDEVKSAKVMHEEKKKRGHARLQGGGGPGSQGGHRETGAAGRRPAGARLSRRGLPQGRKGTAWWSGSRRSTASRATPPPTGARRRWRAACRNSARGPPAAASSTWRATSSSSSRGDRGTSTPTT